MKLERQNPRWKHQRKNCSCDDRNMEKEGKINKDTLDYEPTWETQVLVLANGLCS